jgi:hypothetical protein
VVPSVVRLQALKKTVQSLVESAVVQATEDHGLEGYRVWCDVLGPHLVEQLLRLQNAVSFDAALDQASVDDETWLDLFELHLVKYTKSLLHLAHLRVDLYQNAVRHV